MRNFYDLHQNVHFKHAHEKLTLLQTTFLSNFLNTKYNAYGESCDKFSSIIEKLKNNFI